MRRTEARVAPVNRETATAEQAALLDPLGPRADYHIYRTLVRHPSAFAKFLPWGQFLLYDHGLLPPRDRELAILRTGYLCRSAYEWSKHAAIALTKGVTDAEVAAVKAGAGASIWPAREKALLAACDELVGNHDLGDAAWAGLSEHFTEAERIELIYIVGQYVTVSMMLNSLGVQLEPGKLPDPDLVRLAEDA